MKKKKKKKKTHPPPLPLPLPFFFFFSARAWFFPFFFFSHKYLYPKNPGTSSYLSTPDASGFSSGAAIAAGTVTSYAPSAQEPTS